MRGSYAEWKAELEHVSSLWGSPVTVSEIRVLKTELPLTAGLQGHHDNASWTWEVGNHRLALVLSQWMGQNTQRRLESENKRGAYKCICILERFAIKRTCQASYKTGRPSKMRDSRRCTLRNG